jgi:hypothetical protein
MSYSLHVVWILLEIVESSEICVTFFALHSVQNKRSEYTCAHTTLDLLDDLIGVGRSDLTVGDQCALTSLHALCHTSTSERRRMRTLGRSR